MAARSRPRGQLATDARGRIYMAWYTEGRDDSARMLFAASAAEVY